MVELKNLEKELDIIFGIFSEDKRSKILQAAQKDFESLTKMESGDSVALILESFNAIFKKRSRIVSKKVVNRYKDILRYYSLEDIKQAMSNAKDDEFHKENNYKYCTLEYFSRIEQMDKWINIQKPSDNKGFFVPKFNLKE